MQLRKGVCCTESLSMEIEKVETIAVCKSCGVSGSGKYCSNCGLPYQTKRISMKGLLHDIFRFFTHLDKGFGYTIKMLVIAPGHMQRDYIEGERGKYQKPFSMFFICATVAALSRYWIFQVLVKYYNTASVSEMDFYNDYMVILNVALLPVVALITYAFFFKSGYNFAEIGVFILYLVSFLFLLASCIALLKFFWPELDTAYIELTLFLFYSIITFMNFFNKEPRWSVAIRSVVIISGVFLLIQKLEDYIIESIKQAS